jgi:hypothetical protein
LNLEESARSNLTKAFQWLVRTVTGPHAAVRGVQRLSIAQHAQGDDCIAADALGEAERRWEEAQ